MVELVSGYKSVYGKIYPTLEQAQKDEDDMKLHQGMYGLFRKLPIYPQPDEIAEFIIREYSTIKSLMEKYGR